MRIKRGTTSHAKHKRLRAKTQGYGLVRRSSVRQARQAVLKALHYQYRDRRNGRRTLRSIWIQRINAALREHGLSYSSFMGLMPKAKVTLDRKILADLAIKDPTAFEAIVETVKAGAKAA
jgi:large subunit ribosomal protein L20